MSIILVEVIIFSYILRIRFLLTYERCFSSIELCPLPRAKDLLRSSCFTSWFEFSPLRIPLPVYPFFLIYTSHNIDSQIVDNESHSDIHVFFSMNIEVESLTRNRNELGIQYNIEYWEQSYPYQLSEHLLRMSGLTWEWKIWRIRNRVVHVIFRKITEIWK